MSYTDEQKQQARNRFFQGETIPEIAAALHIERRTLYNWRDAEAWMIARPDDPEILIRQRITLLTNRENKTELEIHELFGMVDKLLAFEKLRNRYQDRKAAESDEPAAGGSGRAKTGGSKKRGPKNDFRDIDETELLEKFREGLFEYQLNMWEHRRARTRNILKSRQIGMTWYFAREALADALLTGHNKVFLSASRAQSDHFFSYIKEAARQWFNAELTGRDKVELLTPHGTALLCFLSTNSNTAQGYTGDLYVDEYFWIKQNFEQLKQVTKPIAAHDKWSRTYFSTPSAKSHDAYPFWSGGEWNETQRKKNLPEATFPSRDELRRGPVLCPDGQVRTIITLDDAIRMGCNMFNRERTESENTPAEYENFYNCHFVDDSDSVFKLAELLKCLVDPEESWSDIKPGIRYAGPVWVGYDPSRSRDGASIIVMAAPLTPGGKFRVLEKINMRDVAWQAQADRIKQITEQYNVRYIGIDNTGNGSGVFEMVKVFYPAATPIFYSIEQKTQLVLKAQQVISQNRIEWPRECSSIAAGFLQIHRCVTGNGQITYAANRTDKTGHADDAWAVMHALMKEGLVPKYMRRRGTVLIG